MVTTTAAELMRKTPYSRNRLYQIKGGYRPPNPHPSLIPGPLIWMLVSRMSSYGWAWAKGSGAGCAQTCQVSRPSEWSSLTGTSPSLQGGEEVTGIPCLTAECSCFID